MRHRGLRDSKNPAPERMKGARGLGWLSLLATAALAASLVASTRSITPFIDGSPLEAGGPMTESWKTPTDSVFIGEQNTADINEDGFVDLLDLGIEVANFGLAALDEPRADVNRDGVVDVLDLAVVARDLGLLAPQPLTAMRIERAFPGLDFRRLTNLVQPDDGQDHMFVTEQSGRILIFPNDQQATRAKTFLDIRDRVSEQNNEEGLLGLAFDPEYRNNGYFYVYYSAASPRRSVLSRFSVNPGNPELADPNSELVIMDIAQPFGNHNGGQLVFGPNGYLYVGLGDGGGGGDPQGNGQNRRSLLGSIIRIDVSGTATEEPYRIPPDNPFAGVDDARGEIWAYGLRNPWRFSFDDHTGFLWVGDVGQNRWEEVDIVKVGSNYGWNIMEGRHCFSPRTNCDETGLQLPLWEYPLTGRNCSVIGGYVFRGRGMPSLLGAYVYADFCSGKIWGLRYDGASVGEQMLLVDSDLFITSFGQDLALNLYVLSRDEGIYRLVPAG